MMNATTITKTSWPKHKTDSVECRKRDLVFRIADWSRQSIRTGEPAYDVEIYHKGVYDWNQSVSFTLREHGTKEAAKAAAIAFTQKMVAELL
jgi:hypothetical protein